MPLNLSSTNLLTSAEISKFIYNCDDISLPVTGGLTSQQIFALEVIADSASALIQRHCDFTFVKSNYVETWDGAGSDEIIPREIPITAISSIKFSTNLNFSSASAIDTNLYCIGSKGLSINFLNGVITPRGRSCVQVAYTAGYENIPKDIKFAALRQMQYMIKQMGKGDGMTGLKMISKMGEAQTKDDSIATSGLIIEVEGMLNSYQRFECSTSTMFTRVS